MHYISLNNIGYLYYLMDDKSKAIEYFNKCLDVLIKSGNKTQLPILYSNLSSLYFETGNKELAKENYQKSNYWYSVIGDSIGLGQNIFNYASMVAIDIDFKTALPDYLKALEIFNRLNSPVNQLEVLFRLGSPEMYKSNPEKAQYYASEMLKKALEYNSLQYLKKAYKIYSDLLELKNVYRGAYTYFKKYTEIKDSILSEAKQKDIIDIETRYQTEKKQQQIELQKVQLLNVGLDLKRKQFAIIALLSIFALSFFAVFAFWYYWRKKKQQQLELAIKNEELATRQYENLYKETQLIAMKEKIAGQEEERSRIARELHDGVGGTLAAVKFQLEQRKEKPNDEDITHLLQTITTTWEEVRSISHNLMPPQFEFLTLPSVLGHFLNSLSKTGKCYFDFQSVPAEGWDKAGQNLQVEIYRIVQEVCGNILKHSGATNANVFLNMEGDYIRLTIEDNGKAFVRNHQTDGIGHISIAQRLLALNGKSQAERLPDGNMYIFEIPLKLNVTV